MSLPNRHQRPAIQVSPPQEISTLGNFLDWWFETLDAAQPNMPLAVVFDSMPRDVADASRAIVTACNHIASDKYLHRVVEPPVVDTAILSETIFLDTESDVETHRRYFHYYSRTLRSVQQQYEIVNGFHVHFTHCSIDKEEAVVALSRAINKLNETATTSFLILSLYRHPDDGYKTGKGNIDTQILPNKTQTKLVSANFHRGLRCIDTTPLKNAGTFLRLAIDDDDIWMPYAFQDIANLANNVMSESGSTTRVIAIGNGFLYYPIDGGRLDMAPLSVAMNGSKAYASSSWNDIGQKSPWTLAERYATNRMGAYKKQDIDVRFTRTARPVLIYVRYGTNLTSLNKMNLYLSEPKTIRHVGGADFAVEAGMKLVEEYELVAAHVFQLDPPILRLQGQVSLDGKRFEINSNIDEFLKGRDLTFDDVKLLLRWRTTERPHAYWLETDDDWSLPYSNLVRSPSIEIRNLEDIKLDKAWARFSGSFPGAEEASSP